MELRTQTEISSSVPLPKQKSRIMLKFIKHHMSSIDGIEIYPIISLIIFTLFFTLLIVYVMRMDKKHVEAIKNSPLEEPKIPFQQ